MWIHCYWPIPSFDMEEIGTPVSAVSVRREPLCHSITRAGPLALLRAESLSLIFCSKSRPFIADRLESRMKGKGIASR